MTTIFNDAPPFGKGKLMNLFVRDPLLYALILDANDITMWESADGTTWKQTAGGSNGKVTFTSAGIPISFAGSPSVVFNNKVFLIGGSRYDTNFRSNKVYYYDFVEKTGWQQSDDASFTPRMGHACIFKNAAPGKGIWVIGGCDEKSATSEVYLYNADNEQWSDLTDLPGPLCMMAATVFNNQIQLFGGFGFLPGSPDKSLMDAYTYINDNWRKINFRSDGSPLPLSYGCAAAVINDNDLYVFNSEFNKNSFDYSVNKIEEDASDTSITKLPVEAFLLMSGSGYSIQTVTFKNKLWFCVVTLDDKGNIASNDLSCWSAGN